MELIYDFETMSQNAITGVIVNVAALQFDPVRFEEDPYDFVELVESSMFMKFDVKEQVEKYGRKVEKESLEWWKKQGKEAQKQLAPSELDEPLIELYNMLVKDLEIGSMKRVWTRGNSFDPVIVDTVFAALGKEKPKNWWAIRDTRSYIEGLAYGTNIRHDFMPPDIEGKIVKHDPRYDIALDVYRMQSIVREL